MREFENAVRTGGWKEIASIIIKASFRLVDATIAGDAETVAAALEEAHMINSSVLLYHDENSLSCTITLAYFSARKDYWLIRELPAGKGFAAIWYLCPAEKVTRDLKLLPESRLRQTGKRRNTCSPFRILKS